jgi:uncharacterized protein YidB (DUF937 family)
MGILDQLQSFASGELGGGANAVAPEQQASVSRALVSALSEHPGGVGGVLDQFRQNGMGQHVDSWVNSQPANSEPGQPAPTGQAPQALTQQQVEQGAGSSLLGNIAQRTGLPQPVITMALTTVLPLVMQHMTPGGQVPEQSQQGGLAQQLLSRFL